MRLLSTSYGTAEHVHKLYRAMARHWKDFRQNVGIQYDTDF